MFTRFDTIHRCDRRTRGYRAMAEAALCAVSCGKKTLSACAPLIYNRCVRRMTLLQGVYSELVILYTVVTQCQPT